ncbi:MAG: ribonuclease H-like domain-containing protein [Peptococcaceae bacterium]|jgi:uncharacterized protein YprB with RNaseH-like and TPR domain|nr:ribonuclease H-like domain-containing protein [Peptococcaceae bacterium]
MAGESAAGVLDRLGDRWKGIIDRAADLDTLKGQGPARDMFPQPAVPGHEEAEMLRKQLLRQYRGRKIEDVFAGEEAGEDGCTCYRMHSRSPLSLSMLDPDTVRERLLGHLRLLYGIGGVTEESLKSQGYHTITDLTRHPRYGPEAARLAAIIGKGDPAELTGWIRRWFPGSHPLAFYCSSFHDPGQLVLLDIETLGLSPDTPVILLGAAFLSGSEVVVSQYLVREIGEEAAVLKLFLSHLNPGSFLVSFNGKSFDVPYLKARMAYYGIKGRIEHPHYDLLYFSRKTWRGGMDNCRLTTLEEHLFGVTRVNDVPSELVPSFYKTYERTGNIGPLVPIIEHNRQDLVTLARLFARLHEEWR